MEGVNIIEKFLPAPTIGQLLSFIGFFSFISLPGKHYLSLELVNPDPLAKHEKEGFKKKTMLLPINLYS